MTLRVLRWIVRAFGGLWRKALSAVRWLLAPCQRCRPSSMHLLLSSREYDARMATEFARAAAADSAVRTAVVAELLTAEPAEAVVAAVEALGAPALGQRGLANLHHALSGMTAAARMKSAASALCAVPFDEGDEAHCHLLLRAGRLLLAPAPLDSLTGPAWEKAGFQGRPATDFRAAGLFGLLQLCRFSTAHTEAARRIIAAAKLPYEGFPLALVSLHLSMLTLALLDRHLLYGVLAEAATARRGWGAQEGGIDASMLATRDPASAEADSVCRPLHVVHAALLLRFDAHWRAAPPPDLMGFSAVFKAFVHAVDRDLEAGCDLLVLRGQD
jgi:hypothetical protein